MLSHFFGISLVGSWKILSSVMENSFEEDFAAADGRFFASVRRPALKKKTQATPESSNKETAGGLPLCFRGGKPPAISPFSNTHQADRSFLPVIHHHQYWFTVAERSSIISVPL
jgi:hypothetical protein